MKKILFILCIALSTSYVFSQVGINKSDPSVNSILDIASNGKGFPVSQLDQTAVDNLAANLVVADAGLILYNTTVPCLQLWDGTAFSCFEFPVASTDGNSGVVQVIVEGTGGQRAREAANAGTGPADVGGGDTSFPGYVNLGPNVGSFVPINLDPANLAIGGITNWPESETNQTLSGIHLNDQFNLPADGTTPINSIGGTADSLLENGSLGQVHFCRVILYVYHDNNGFQEGNLEVRLRNPQSGFFTSETQFAPSEDGIFELSFLLITIADGASLPDAPGCDTLHGGCNGNGYFFELFAAEAPINDIWIDSITRISDFNDN